MDRVYRFCIWTLLLVWTGAGVSLADENDEAGSERDAREAIRAVLVETTRNTFDELNRNRDRIRSDPALLRLLIEKNLAPSVSIVASSRQAMGSDHWKYASTTQRKAFAREFRSLLLNFYSSSLHEYLRRTETRFSMDMVEYSQPEINQFNRNYAKVVSFFRLEGESPYRVVYRMTRVNDRWKIYDVEVPQGSVMDNYNMQFQSQIKAGGIDNLIDALRKRNRELLTRVKHRDE